MATKPLCIKPAVRAAKRNISAAVFAPSAAHPTSVVTRAATAETRTHVPYNIVLVDAAEGFRMMAHGANDLRIGDSVSARFTQFAGRLVPYFER
jgi:DUF35 OB-fold domain, acyl-CoA-associated